MHHHYTIISEPNVAITMYLHGAVKETCQVKDKEIQDKVDEVKLLQREKSELERARHTDMVKLRLEVLFSIIINSYLV